MIVVADSSPLIAMGRIGQLEILHAVFGQLLVPEAVWQEVVEAAAEKPGSSEIAAAYWIERRTVKDSAWGTVLNTHVVLLLVSSKKSAKQKVQKKVPWITPSSFSSSA